MTYIGSSNFHICHNSLLPCHDFLMCKNRLPFSDDYFRSNQRKKSYVLPRFICRQCVKTAPAVGILFCHIMAEA